MGLWHILAALTLPISALKQLVSVLQLVVACRNLASLDVVARSKAKYEAAALERVQEQQPGS